HHREMGRRRLQRPGRPARHPEVVEEAGRGGQDRRRDSADQRPAAQHPEQGRPQRERRSVESHPEKEQDHREVAQCRVYRVSTDAEPTAHVACVTATSRMMKPMTATRACTTTTGIGRARFCMCCAKRKKPPSAATMNTTSAVFAPSGTPPWTTATMRR